MAGWMQCLTEIREAAGVEFTDDELTAILEDIMKRKDQARDRIRLSQDEQYRQAAMEVAEQLRIQAAKEKAIRLQNLAKRVSRREFYESAPNSGRTPGIVMGLRARLTGVNTPFQGSRQSVDAEGHALTRDYLNGLATDLERAGLFGAARGGTLDRLWARELGELNKREGGEPGVTGNPQALEIAKIIHKYQRLSVDGLNKSGAWIGDLDGYITRQSHDADKLRRATFETWRDKILPRLDERTFEGIDDPDRFLRNVYNALVSGVHLKYDGMQGFKDPVFKGPGNLAKRLSQSRVLHFKGADDWLDYHREFGRGTLIDGIVRSLEQAARNTALMRTFGTNPRAELEADIQWLREKYRDNLPKVEALNRWAKPLMNRMDILDGTSRTPVHEMGARISGGVRAVQNVAKLGGVLLSSISDIPLKASELRYQGVNLLEAYGDALASLGRGRGSGETREIMDLLRAGLDGMAGDVASRFDAADTVPGTLSAIQNRFFQISGLNWWTDAQRGGAALVLARHLGREKATAWGGLSPETRRGLEMAGVDESRWDLLRSAGWRQANGRHYLTPDIALKLDDAAVEAWLRSTGKLRSEDAATVARRVGQAKEDMGLQLAAYYNDRADYAVLQPGAEERAILLQGTRPGTPKGEAIRLIAQFKAFPAAIISRAWGRELYGGQGGFSKVAGVTHMLVGSVVFGYLAMAAKDLAKGRTPRDPTSPKTWAAAFVQGGGAGIYGDFLFGEYNRFDRSFAASLLGPTLGQVDDIADLWTRLRNGDDVAAQALRWAQSNTPFANVFYLKPIFDYLVFYQISEALNPGYLRRFERRVQQENEQTFLVRPSEIVPRGGGDLRLEALAR